MEGPAKLLHADIAEISRLVFSGPCRKLVAPAADGEVCILPRHAPLLSCLRPGEVRLQTEEGEDHFFFVAGGCLEIKDGTVTVLADEMLRSAEIDRDAALVAKQQAQEILKTSRPFTRSDLAELQLLKAVAQLRVLEHAEIYKLRKLHR